MTKCKCGEEMTFEFRWDDAQLTDHCFNVYVCEECGTILKEDVWENKGKVFISINNEVTTNA